MLKVPWRRQLCTIDALFGTVSKDAATDEQLGLIYPSRVRLATTRMRVDMEDVELTPGMAVTVKIRPVVEG